MVAISIMIEGQMGLTWPRWERLCAEVEALGFAGLFRSDHFTGGAPPDQEALETVVSLAYLADHTRRIHFGTLVAAPGALPARAVSIASTSSRSAISSASSA